jgi:cytochrome c oxidase subunit II
MSKKLIKIVRIVLAGIVLSGCIATPSVLNPQSSVASSEADLYNIVLIIAAGVFILVEGGLVFTIIKHRRKRGDTNEPAQVTGNTTLEIIWTAIPVVLVIILFVLTLNTMQAVAAPPASKGDINVVAIGHRWWWEFDYPDLGIKTADELHIPAGVTVQITLESTDVIHSFWVPQLSGKTDVVPGQTNHTWLNVPGVGIYAGQCSEFCGIEHANMRFNVVVQSAADFQTWVTNQQQPAPAPQTDLEKAGAQIVTQGVCAACHTIDGTAAKAVVGPNLTHLYSRGIFAGGIAALTDANVKAWVMDSAAMKPGSLMASVHVSQQDIDKVMAYLKTLK